MEFDFDLGFDFNEEISDNPEADKIRENKPTHVKCLERKTRHLYRRAYSETQLLDLNLEFKEGYSYHFITGGDVDMLSYFKLILRQIKKIDHVLMSTWCMAGEDIYQIKDWLDNGTIKNIDMYLGEIFQGTYKKEYELLKDVVKDKLKIFRNHSKVISGYNDDFYFGIESSANINTNPRTENACITIDKNIYEFYNEFYSNITGFNKK